jgi:lysophospholipase L1-like esterase
LNIEHFFPLLILRNTFPSMTYTYLALGDSYTIGEGVPLYENFPYQTVKNLRSAGYAFHAPEIVAKTGWTTDELQHGIQDWPLLVSYHFVTLLIGVNNQYRGRSVDHYAPEFALLLDEAIGFAAGQRNRVFVLSIPDWGATPFAEGRDSEQIAREIDGFNDAALDIARQHEVHFLNITPGTREASADKSLLAADHLHPSGKEYARWANQLAAGIINEIK